MLKQSPAVIIAHHNANHLGLGSNLHIFTQTPNMTAIEKLDHRNRPLFCLLHCQRHSLMANSLSKPPTAIDNRRGIGLAHNRDLLPGTHAPFPERLNVLHNPNHTVRIVPHQIGQHQRMRNLARFFRAQSRTLKHLRTSHFESFNIQNRHTPSSPNHDRALIYI